MLDNDCVDQLYCRTNIASALSILTLDWYFFFFFFFKFHSLLMKGHFGIFFVILKLLRVVRFPLC